MYIKKISIHNRVDTPENVDGYRVHVDTQLVGTISYVASKTVYEYDDVKKYGIAVFVNGSAAGAHPIQLSEVKVFAAKEGF